MAPLKKESGDIEPMMSGLLLAFGTTLYWLMQPVSPWLEWSHGTPFTQILMPPGYFDAFAQSLGVTLVEYSPTTWYQELALMSPHSGCQSAAEPRPALGLKMYAES